VTTDVGGLRRNPLQLRKKLKTDNREPATAVVLTETLKRESNRGVSNQTTQEKEINRQLRTTGQALNHRHVKKGGRARGGGGRGN